MDAIAFELQSNKILQAISGVHSNNFSLLENLLQVQIHNRGSMVRIFGRDKEKALNILQSLSEKAENNVIINESEVRAMVNLSLEVNYAPLSIHLKDNVIITSRSINQHRFLNQLQSKSLVFGVGTAGSGKTLLSIAHACKLLEQNDIRRIVLCRPAIEAGERIGFLPGEIKEKMDPYMRPLYDALEFCLSAKTLQKHLENGVIEILPLAFMRGRTLKDAFILLDEAQNATNVQIKMFITRLGEGSSMAVVGDPSQTDIASSQSGLLDAINTTKNLSDIDTVHFDTSDVVRHPLVSEVIAAYDSENERSK